MRRSVTNSSIWRFSSPDDKIIILEIVQNKQEVDMMITKVVTNTTGWKVKITF